MDLGKTLEATIIKMSVFNMDPPTARNYVQKRQGRAKTGFGQVALGVNVVVAMHIVDFIGSLGEKLLDALDG